MAGGSHSTKEQNCQNGLKESNMDKKDMNAECVMEEIREAMIRHFGLHSYFHDDIVKAEYKVGIYDTDGIKHIIEGEVLSCAPKRSVSRIISMQKTEQENN